VIVSSDWQRNPVTLLKPCGYALLEIVVWAAE
jgi:hypothetical protein